MLFFRFTIRYLTDILIDTNRFEQSGTVSSWFVNCARDGAA
jgi:hypothetical protein